MGTWDSVDPRLLGRLIARSEQLTGQPVPGAARLVESGAAILPTAGKPRTRKRPTPATVADLALTLTEAEWQTEVVAYAETHGWVAWHDRDPRLNDAGWPDLFLLHTAWHEHLWVELKTETGTIRPEQTVMHARLAAAGAEIHLWRPRHRREMHNRLGTSPSARKQAAEPPDRPAKSPDPPSQDRHST